MARMDPHGGCIGRRPIIGCRAAAAAALLALMMIVGTAEAGATVDPPVVTAFAPDTAEACAHYVRGSVTGENIVDGLTVRLTKDGEPDVKGKLFSSFPVDPVVVGFWLTGSTALGPWTVEVANPDGRSDTPPNAVTVVTRLLSPTTIFRVRWTDNVSSISETWVETHSPICYCNGK